MKQKIMIVFLLLIQGVSLAESNEFIVQHIINSLRSYDITEIFSEQVEMFQFDHDNSTVFEHEDLNMNSFHNTNEDYKPQDNGFIFRERVRTKYGIDLMTLKPIVVKQEGIFDIYYKPNTESKCAAIYMYNKNERTGRIFYSN